jgi:hypothetical protein
MPTSSHVWNAYSAPAVCWISKPEDFVASFLLFDPKDCVVRACVELDPCLLGGICVLWSWALGFRCRWIRSIA